MKPGEVSPSADVPAVLPQVPPLLVNPWPSPHTSPSPSSPVQHASTPSTYSTTPARSPQDQEAEDSCVTELLGQDE